MERPFSELSAEWLRRRGELVPKMPFHLRLAWIAAFVIPLGTLAALLLGGGPWAGVFVGTFAGSLLGEHWWARRFDSVAADGEEGADA